MQRLRGSKMNGKTFGVSEKLSGFVFFCFLFGFLPLLISLFIFHFTKVSSLGVTNSDLFCFSFLLVCSPFFLPYSTLYLSRGFITILASLLQMVPSLGHYLLNYHTKFIYNHYNRTLSLNTITLS